ncbi:MAG: hypothetical protein KAI83_11665 [Thiomargarita sp.]|nr:hypothetical protein [Thiomargarita sp.]
MQNFTLQTHVGSDCILQLKVPPYLTNTDIKVTVTLQKIMPTTSPKKRTVGEYVGKIHISDDFYAPLSDEFWFGESDK